MASLLGTAGFKGLQKPEQAEILIVNTCGFIKPARDESIEELQNLAKKKKKGQILIAAGCLTQRYRELIAITGPRNRWHHWHKTMDGYHRFDSGTPKRTQ